MSITSLYTKCQDGLFVLKFQYKCTVPISTNHAAGRWASKLEAPSGAWLHYSVSSRRLLVFFSRRLAVWGRDPTNTRASNLPMKRPEALYWTKRRVRASSYLSLPLRRREGNAGGSDVKDGRKDTGVSWRTRICSFRRSASLTSE